MFLLISRFCVENRHLLGKIRGIIATRGFFRSLLTGFGSKRSLLTVKRGFFDKRSLWPSRRCFWTSWGSGTWNNVPGGLDRPGRHLARQVELVLAWPLGFRGVPGGGRGGNEFSDQKSWDLSKIRKIVFFHDLDPADVDFDVPRADLLTFVEPQHNLCCPSTKVLYLVLWDVKWRPGDQKVVYDHGSGNF